MRRVFFSLLVVGVVFALAYGAAASLTVSGGVAQSGSASATCDSDGVTVNYVLDTDNNVDQVVVSGIGSSCQGADVIVTTYDTSNQKINNLSGVCADLGSGKSTATVGTNANVNPGDIGSVQVVIASTAANSNSNCSAS